MRQVRTIIDTYCDVCRAELDTETEATEEITLSIDGRAKRLDACVSHKDPAWSQIVAYAVDDIDPKPAPAAKPQRQDKGPREMMPCPLCGAPLVTGFLGLNTHVIKAHADAIAPAERSAWIWERLPHDRASRSDPRNAVPMKCPRCDWVSTGGASGLYPHLGNIHHLNLAGQHEDVARAERLESAPKPRRGRPAKRPLETN